MKTRFVVTFLAALLLATFEARVVTGRPLIEVNGHGLWVLNTGNVYENHQPYIESTMIHAWLDEDGTAHGTMVWMDTFNGPLDDHGQAVSGYTWQVNIDRFEVISANEVYVEGVVTHSVIDADIGVRTGFFIRDNGRTDPDAINGVPVLAGNFTIR